jgi:hypothetical protein
MATITPPAPARDLVESQRHVRHPLERIRGTIRTYVGLEGVALLLTLLALWFWVTFVLDFGPFRALELDWVQDVPYRWVRALVLGWFFLLGVVALRSDLIRRLYRGEVASISRTAFATTAKRQTLPVWLRLPLVGMAVPLLTLGVATVIALFGERAAEVSAYIGALGVLPLTAFLIPALHELYGVTSSVSRWVRAPLTGLCAAGGALLGATLGATLTSGGLEETSVGIAALIGGGLGAMAGDVFALVNIGVVAGLVRRQGYLVAVTVPCVLAYLLGWLVAGLAAGVSPWLSGALVLLLMAGPVLAVVAARLFRDFSDASLALVLERRFPAVLGDRLITAVELADPKKAAAYGYSEVMIEHTIHQAADLVRTVPAREVFDWNRLYRYWAGVAALTVGLYLVAGGLFCIPLIGETGAGERAGFGAFHQAAGLALERNLLLQNVIWPRRAFLEILDWPEGRDKHVGKDEAALSIKVRAYKWVVADPKAPEGWRALTWHDLQKNRHLLGEAAPAVNFREADEQGKKDWGQPRDPALGWTLDEIETRLSREETHETVEVDTKDKLRDALTKLDERARDPAMRRTLRMLIVPSLVTIRYRGLRGGGELSLQRQGDNEYSGQFPDLKETVTFTARGEDYETPRYRITVVPPPALVKMAASEERAAYMLYRVRGDDPGLLRGLKQLMPERPISTTGGDTSRLEGVPAGSNIVLKCESDKELKEVVIDEPRKGAAPVKGTPELLTPRTFQVRFDDVRTTLDFYFRFVDTENVKGERHVIIKPQDDAPPEVSIDVKVIRKTPQGYMVTPSAYIPLEAKVLDDRGLHLVEYACSVTKLDRQAEQSGRGLFALAAIHLLPGGPGQELAAAARIASLSREAKTGPKPSNQTAVQHYPVLTFRTNPDEYLLPEQIKENLAKPSPLKVDLKREFLIEKLEEKDIRNKDTDPPYFFNIDQVKGPDGKRLKVEDRDSIQPRYRLQLWMEAVDTDIETGREVLTTAKGVEYRGNRGRSKETLTFIVVPENELLAEIAKEEDNLYIKLGEQIKRLKDGLDKLDDMKRDLTVQGLKADQFVAMQARADELAQTLDKGELTCNEVSSDYQRILKELVTNRVEPAMIERVQKQIVEPLNVAVNGDENDKKATDTFPMTKAGITDLRNVVAGEANLDDKITKARAATDEARLRLNGLIKRLNDVLDKMEALKDINKLIKDLQEIEREENRQKEVLQAIKKIIDDKLLDDLRGLKP